MTQNKLKIIFTLSFVASQIVGQVDSLRSKLLKLKTDSAIVRTLSAIGKEYQKQNADSAIYYHNAIINYVQKRNQKIYLIEALKDLGFDYYLKGDNLKAVEYFEKGLKEINSISIKTLSIGEKLKLNKLTASVYGNLGILFGDESDYTNSLIYFYKCLSIFEIIGDYDGLVRSNNNIAIIYKNLKNYNKSIEYYNKAINSEIINKNKIGLDHIYSGLAEIYYVKGEYLKSIEYYTNAFKISEENNDVRSSIVCLNGLGEVYHSIKKNNLALDEYKKALTLSGNMSVKSNVSRTFQLMSIIYIENANYNLAEISLKNSLADSDVDMLSYSYALLSNLYDKTNKPRLSLVYYKKSIKIRDSLYGQEKLANVIQQEFKFQYAKRAAADSILFAKNSELKDKELEKQKVEIKVKRYQQYGLFGGLAFVMLFAGFMVNRFRITTRQKKVIEIQKQLVDEKQKEILDSIRYAKHIQASLITSEKYIEKSLNKLQRKQ